MEESIQEKEMKYYSLIDKVYSEKNLLKAYGRVESNRGAPGIDGVTVEMFAEKLPEEIERLSGEIKRGEYKPMSLRRVEIPKADGKTRQLRIPAVRDRVVQQSLKEVLEPIFEEGFHPSSYGYRKGRNAWQAVEKAKAFASKYGLSNVVELDLSECFDTLDHEKIIDSVAERVSDGKILKLIRAILKSGVMEDGVWKATETGSPQGGVISPLLANIYLNEFDQKMKARGIRIVRYADDILIFSKTQEEAREFLAIAINILEIDMKLKVNRNKTRITTLEDGFHFLGFEIKGERVGIEKSRLKRFKEKVRKLTRRNQSRPVKEIVKQLNPLLRGFASYFRIVDFQSILRGLLSWIRRRLRAIILHQWKTTKKLNRVLRRTGWKEKVNMRMNKWRSSHSKAANYAIPNRFFEEMNLVDMTKYHHPLSKFPILDP
mgnify:FL=1